MNLKHIMLGERNQTQEITYCIIPFRQHSRKGETIWREKSSVVTKRLRMGTEIKKGQPMGYLWNVGNVLYPINVASYIVYACVKTHRTVHVKMLMKYLLHINTYS